LKISNIAVRGLDKYFVIIITYFYALIILKVEANPGFKIYLCDFVQLFKLSEKLVFIEVVSISLDYYIMSRVTGR
jgi:hypothetical protein